MDAARKAVLATSIGNAVEWFDFGIYSYLAVTIGKVFFPEMSSGVQLIYSFATFAVAFIARPLGGIFFGMLGDRWGRKRVLVTYNVSTSVFGGTAPLVVSWLINWTGDRLVPAYYLVAVSVIGLIVVTRFVKDPSGKSLRGSPPAVEEKHEIKEALQNP